MDLKTLEFVGGIVFLFVYLSAIYARRQNLSHNMRQFVRAGGAALIAFAVSEMISELKNYALFIGAAVLILMYRSRPRRRRGMTAETKRRVIAKWQYETGKKYNAQKYEIDHIVPFSDGGSDSEDNLRVIERRRNRSKGAQPAWWDLFGRRR